MTGHEDEHCEVCDGPLTDPETGYSRVGLVEVRGVYDGGLYLVHAVTDCEYAWHRWTDPYMREKAQPYIEKWNKHRGYNTPPL